MDKFGSTIAQHQATLYISESASRIVFSNIMAWTDRVIKKFLLKFPKAPSFELNGKLVPLVVQSNASLYPRICFNYRHQTFQDDRG